MNLRGASTIGVVLIILLSIVSIGVFLSVVFKNIRNATAEERAKCIGIDLKVTQCMVFPQGYTLPNSNYPLQDNGIYVIVERAYGGGEINDMRLQLVYSNGDQEVLSPVNLSGVGYNIVTGYKDFLEHSSTEVALLPVTYTPSKYPATLSVSAVVGKKDTICEPVAEPLACAVFSP